MRYVTFSFDDGFRDSTIKTAKIFESFGLKAEFNVVASFALGLGGQQEASEYAHFELLNALQARGHVVQPHGYDHTNKTQVDFADATALIDRCIELFSENLSGFTASRSIFVFPYNASNEKIENYVAGKFRAFRTGYNRVINALPDGDTKMIYGDSWPNAEAQIDRSIQTLLNMEDGWLVYNTHGLDGEGWEPISSAYLERTLARLQSYPDVKILPIVEVLQENPNA